MSEEARGIFRLARTLRAEEVLAEQLERRYVEADARRAISIARERREKRGEEKFTFSAHPLSNIKCADLNVSSGRQWTSLYLISVAALFLLAHVFSDWEGLAAEWERWRRWSQMEQDDHQPQHIYVLPQEVAHRRRRLG